MNVVFGEGNSEDFLSDDSKFSRSTLYDWALHTLRTFEESLSNVISSWEELYKDEIKNLRESGPVGDRVSREKILAKIDENVQKLRKMAQTIDSRTSRLRGLSDSVSLKLYSNIRSCILQIFNLGSCVFSLERKSCYLQTVD